MSLFTDLRKDLAGSEPETVEKVAVFDVLLDGLHRGDFPDDEKLRAYVAELAEATDKGNEYEHVVLEHQALGELLDALTPQR